METESAVKFYFHPILVHFPIAFYFLEFLLLCLWFFKKDESYKRFAFLTFRFAYVMMALAMIAGYVDAGGINSHVRNHFLSALSLFVYSTLRGIIWFREMRNLSPRKTILLALSLVGIIIVGVTGDLGGDLVYHF